MPRTAGGWRLGVEDDTEHDAEDDQRRGRVDEGPGPPEDALLVPGPQLTLGEVVDEIPVGPELGNGCHCFPSGPRRPTRLPVRSRRSVPPGRPDGGPRQGLWPGILRLGGPGRAADRRTRRRSGRVTTLHRRRRASAAVRARRASRAVGASAGQRHRAPAATASTSPGSTTVPRSSAATSSAITSPRAAQHRQPRPQVVEHPGAERQLGLDVAVVQRHADVGAAQPRTPLGVGNPVGRRTTTRSRRPSSATRRRARSTSGMSPTAGVGCGPARNAAPTRGSGICPMASTNASGSSHGYSPPPQRATNASAANGPAGAAERRRADVRRLVGQTERDDPHQWRRGPDPRPPPAGSGGRPPTACRARGDAGARWPPAPRRPRPGGPPGGARRRRPSPRWALSGSPRRDSRVSSRPGS